jgi:hypothetical protein
MTDQDDVDRELAELTVNEALAQHWACSVEVHPLCVGETIEDFNWVVKVTTTCGSDSLHKDLLSETYMVPGEPGGPFQAIQRAIDKHAFGIEL